MGSSLKEAGWSASLHTLKTHQEGYGVYNHGRPETLNTWTASVFHIPIVQVHIRGYLGGKGRVGPQAGDMVTCVWGNMVALWVVDWELGMMFVSISTKREVSWSIFASNLELTILSTSADVIGLFPRSFCATSRLQWILSSPSIALKTSSTSVLLVWMPGQGPQYKSLFL